MIRNAVPADHAALLAALENAFRAAEGFTLARRDPARRIYESAGFTSVRTFGVLLKTL